MAPHGTGRLHVRRDSIRRIWPLIPGSIALRDDIQTFLERTKPPPRWQLATRSHFARRSAPSVRLCVYGT
jgi:hypothetical protein